MIDLHAHVLPGLDDGPTTTPEALALLRALSADGIGTVVAAAHAYDGIYNASRTAILTATEQLQAAADEQGIAIRIVPSMEVQLSYDALQAAAAGELLPVGAGNCLVLELPHDEFPHFTERALFELMMAGYQPILNHPERNQALQSHPGLYARLVERGVVGMVTAASVTGQFGAKAKRLSRQWLDEGLAACIATDAHDTVGRSPRMTSALAAVPEVRAAVQETAATIIG
jgi:protein-tyrosine phosphatase